MKNKGYIILAGICLLAAGLWYSNKMKQSEQVFAERTEIIQEIERPAEVLDVPDSTEEEPDIIKFHITGAVKSPGVYELLDGERIIDAVEMAGGALETADLEKINLSEFVHDAQKIRIPFADEDLPEDLPKNLPEDVKAVSEVYISDTESKKETETGLININTASVAELTKLSGIGEVRANDIIAYRQANGEFKSIEEIKNVSGIGDKTFDKIKELITVR